MAAESNRQRESYESDTLTTRPLTPTLSCLLTLRSTPRKILFAALTSLVYDAVREKLSTLCVLMYLSSLNLKTGPPIART